MQRIRERSRRHKETPPARPDLREPTAARCKPSLHMPVASPRFHSVRYWKGHDTQLLRRKRKAQQANPSLISLPNEGNERVHHNKNNWILLFKGNDTAPQNKTVLYSSGPSVQVSTTTCFRDSFAFLTSSVTRASSPFTCSNSSSSNGAADRSDLSDADSRCACTCFSTPSA